MKLCIVLYSARRLQYALRTIRMVRDNLYGAKASWHIADDGSTPDDVVTMASEVRTGSTTQARGRGYGASYNLATHATHADSDMFLCLEDDWELTRPLNVAPLLEDLQALRQANGIGACIRLGYIGWTQPLRGEFVYINRRHYLRFDPESPEHHVFSGHPRLETREWQRRLGLWPEEKPAGQTEFEVSARRESRLDVYWPLWLVKPEGDLFAHIGTEKARTD